MVKTCPVCTREFEAKRATRITCSERCRKRAQRALAPVVKPRKRAASSSKPRARAGKSTGPKLVAIVDAPRSLAPDPGGNPEHGGLARATWAELNAAGRLETALGQAALFVARRIDELGLTETGSGAAALVKEHRAALAEATKDAKVDDDPVEAIRRSAALKLVSGGAS